ncbi:gephyrin-like molybdotransferase Glp [Sporomusa malonica]|uniref:Molybdopterin molybdenumtransferase n=1 Tax=Sporomusa malonica TaxID=112901 RepID=A0A1W1YP80_9FIRM|nr:gephyrin-like molybdotransferase Glp [Sporomusa malonica]SMC37943.1 molybdopterin molybdotransferase [Sporomusa malonica]
MKTSISLEEAQSSLLELVQPVKQSQVSLFDAVGRVLCRDIQSGVNLPTFNKSPLDGYALQAKDTEQAELSNPVILEVIEEVRAGFMPENKVISGSTIKVMTGAPIPEGANEIVKYEDVKREGNFIKLFYPLTPGKNVIQAGEDVLQGETIAQRGTLLTPPLVGLLAAIGVAEVPVYEKVKIAILSTGDELLDPSKELLPGKIYNSNLHSLGAFCSQLGAEPISMGIVPDEKDAIVERITQALKESDLVITTGGVSVGDYDVVPDALKQIGADKIFWKVDMKPGSPVIAAKQNNKLIIGLSGNPAAALITFDLIVVPLIKKMMGLEKQFPAKIFAILTENFNKPSQQRRFLRAKVQRNNEVNYVKLTGEQSNGVLKSMIDCNALIDVPAGSGPLIAGQEVSAVVLGNDHGSFIGEV